MTEPKVNAIESTYQRVVIELEIKERLIKKALIARYLVTGYDQPGSKRWYASTYDVLETAKKAIVVIVERGDKREMFVFDNFDSFKDEEYPEDLISMVASELDVDYIQDLDL